MKDIQIKAMDLVRKRMQGMHMENAKVVPALTLGRNNWRKMHGFPLMRGEARKTERRFYRKFNGIYK